MSDPVVCKAMAKVEGVPKLALNLDSGHLEMQISLTMPVDMEVFRWISLSRKDGLQVELMPVRQPLPLN